MTENTLLSFAELDLPPYSVRALTQTLIPIDAAGNLVRSINGELMDLSASQFRKYQSVISCTDQQSPTIDGIWQGMTLTVDCICELSYKTAGGAPAKTVVTDSSRIEGAFTFYRPQLVMRVMQWNISTDEYGADVGWQITLEEI